MLLQLDKEEETTIQKNKTMLSPLMFIIGFIIFLLYMSGLLWMIKSSHDDQRRRRERDERLNQSDENDYDGGGNWGRFENE